MGHHGNVTSIKPGGVLLASFGKITKRLRRPKPCEDRTMGSVDDGIQASGSCLRSIKWDCLEEDEVFLVVVHEARRKASIRY